MDGIQEGLKLGNDATMLAGKLFAPWFMRRQANADAHATLQAVLTDQVATHMESHPNDPAMMEAIISCNGKFDFDNLCRIVRLAIPQLGKEARPDLIADDWGANFRDKARTCSDPEMAELWAQLLAGQANSPGSYSRKTVNTLADMEPGDAHLFKSLSNCRLIPVDPIPGEGPDGQNMFWGFKRASTSPKLAVLDDRHSMYNDQGINFDSLARLEWLGLVRYVDVGYGETRDTDKFSAYEHSTGQLYLANSGFISFGRAEFTPAGAQLSELCVPLESPTGFIDYLIEVWRSQGVRVTDDIVEVLNT